MKNGVYKPGSMLKYAVTNPTSPASGDPVRIGKMTGVATADMDTSDNKTVCDTGEFVANFPVTAKAGGAIAIGDRLFIKDGSGSAKATITNDDNSTANIFYGFSLGVVAAGATATIPVRHISGVGI
ncbi:MAG TPA: DUF2190 family protein [Methanospirillum sp.]|uniref:DUF2190 family protein n=1 Tax=Methanospirillum sp. TaxID=45200 RepID=UPI002C8816D6|nr:DUF2190 family protein [Methanospirillum sp.]HWQ65018.1 DUF2190 family protein [Methanospirillum sp.]